MPLNRAVILYQWSKLSYCDHEMINHAMRDRQIGRHTTEFLAHTDQVKITLDAKFFGPYDLDGDWPVIRHVLQTVWAYDPHAIYTSEHQPTVYHPITQILFDVYDEYHHHEWDIESQVPVQPTSSLRLRVLAQNIAVAATLEMRRHAHEHQRAHALTAMLK